MLRQAVLFVPLAFILPMIAGLNALGVFASFAVTDVVVFAMAITAIGKLFKTNKN